MASRRVATTAVNWTEFARKIPPSQKASFAAMKQKYDDYLRAVNSLPESAPKIAFDGYKSKIPVAGMVDEFQKKYEGLQIPYPKDNVSGSVSQMKFYPVSFDSKTVIFSVRFAISPKEARVHQVLR